MKRMWPYLGALLPFTTAMSLPAKGLVGDFNDDAQKPMRTKNDGAEEEGKRLSDAQSSKEGSGGSKSDAHAPAHGSPADADYGAYDDEDPDGFDPDSNSTNPAKLFSHADLDGGMYASGTAGGKSHSGGGGGTVSLKGSPSAESTSSSDDGAGGGSNGPVNDPFDDTGYVEPDPADADAMMILLGGTATGSGDGAKSSGDVNLEIIDYGWYTVGHGYAKYSASGSDGATADTFASVEGADLAFVIAFDYGYLNNAYSVTYVYALDFEEDAFAQTFGWNDLLMQGPFAQWLTGPEEDVSIDGNIVSLSLSTHLQGDDNVATFGGTTTTLTHIGSSAAAWIQSEQGSLSLNGSAAGIDTLIAAAGSLVEIDDQYSSVTGVIVGIG